MKKENPMFFEGYESRYFVIRDQGTLLVNYDSKPTSKKKSKGIFKIKDILINDLNPLTGDFLINHVGTNTYLRAKTIEEKNKWIDSLEFLKQCNLR